MLYRSTSTLWCLADPYDLLTKMVREEGNEEDARGGREEEIK